MGKIVLWANLVYWSDALLVTDLSTLVNQEEIAVLDKADKAPLCIKLKHTQQSWPSLPVSLETFLVS